MTRRRRLSTEALSRPRTPVDALRRHRGDVKEGIGAIAATPVDATLKMGRRHER